MGSALLMDVGLSPEVKPGWLVFNTADVPSQSTCFSLCLLPELKEMVRGAHASVQAAAFQGGGLCEQCLHADLPGMKWTRRNLTP